MSNLKYANMIPADVRKMIASKKIIGQTSGMCAGYAQANLVILPKDLAYDFLVFAQRNPKPCPLLEVTDPGNKVLQFIGKGANIATDIPKYRVYKDGILCEEKMDIEDIWQDDFVSFLLGCSFSFESMLLEHDVPVRHIEEGRNVPMYKTNIPCVPAGTFHGNMVVSMRPIPYENIVKSVTITEQVPSVHGTPIHIGNPEYIGISDINHPDFGDSVTINEGEVPVFWACGVTPQNIIMDSKPPIAITHAPGHMFITDVKNTELRR